MRKLPSKNDLFKGQYFEQEIIVLCVRWYRRYKLSYRDLVEMLAARGISIAHTTIRGIELMHRIRKGQFDLRGLVTQGQTTPEVWAAVLAARASRH